MIITETKIKTANMNWGQYCRHAFALIMCNWESINNCNFASTVLEIS